MRGDEHHGDRSLASACTLRNPHKMGKAKNSTFEKGKDLTREGREPTKWSRGLKLLYVLSKTRSDEGQGENLNGSATARVFERKDSRGSPS